MITALFDGFALSQFLAALIGLGTLWYWYMTKEYRKWQAKEITSIKPAFLFGNMKKVFLGKESIMEFQREFYNKTKGHR